MKGPQNKTFRITTLRIWYNGVCGPS